MNTVTQAQRNELYEAARWITELDDEGQIIGGLDATASALAATRNVSFNRARAAVARVARQKRHPQERNVGGRPTLSATEDNVKVEIVMPRSLAAKLDTIAPNGNRSAWIRAQIEQA